MHYPRSASTVLCCLALGVTGLYGLETITVQADDRRQTILGLGTGLEKNTNNLLDVAAGRDVLADQLQVGVVRVMIDPATMPDPATFTLAPMQRWIDLAAHLKPRVGGRLTVIGTVYSPPGWMKSSGTVEDSGRLLPEHADAFGTWLVRVVAECRAAGLEFTAVSIEDDPVFAEAGPGRAAMDMTVYPLAASAVAKAADLAGDPVRLCGPEDWGYKFNRAVAYGEFAMYDPAVRHRWAAWAFTEFVSTVDTTVPSAAGWTNGRLALENYDLPLWLTSHEGEADTWTGAQDIADRISEALGAGQASVWMYRTLLGLTAESITKVVTATNSVTLSTKGSVIRHFSRHIRPGAVQVGAGNGLAFVHDQDRTLSVILRNRSDAAVTHRVVPDARYGVTSFSVVRSTSTEKYVAQAAVAVVDGGADLTLPAQSVVTLQGTLAGDPAPVVSAPVVSAGVDVEVLEATATLTGNATGPVTWTQVSGPAAVIADPSSPVTGLTLPAPGRYVFQLTSASPWPVSDRVSVLWDLPPEPINAGSDRTITLPANITLAATGGTDPDGLPRPAETRLSWTQVSGPATATIDSPLSRTTLIRFPAEAPGTYVFAVSSDDGDTMVSDTVTVEALPAAPTWGTPFAVDLANRRQTIIGFGSAMYDADSRTRAMWENPVVQQRLMQDIGISVIRVISRQIQPSEDLTTSGPIDLSRYDGSALDWQGNVVTGLRQYQIDGLTPLLTIYSPAAWMKTNNDVVNGGRLRRDRYEHFARWSAAMVQLLQTRYGITPAGVSLQNEPEFALFYESCLYSAAEYREAAKALARTFADQGIAVPLIGNEDVGYFRNRWWPAVTGLLGDPTANAALRAVAIHHYVDTAKTGEVIRGWADYRLLTEPKDLPTWMTESSAGRDSDWNNGSMTDGALMYAKRIHQALRWGEVEMWNTWQILGTMEQDEESLSINGLPSKNSSIFKHYARHIRPGAVRVAAGPSYTVGMAELTTDASVWVHDANRTCTVVACNFSTVEDRLRLTGLPPVGSFTAWRTSATEDHALIGTFPVVDGAADIPLMGSCIITLQGTLAPEATVPTATATALRSVAWTGVPATVALDGVTSAPGAWSVIKAPAGATPVFTDATDPATTVVCPVAGEYVFALTVPGAFPARATTKVVLHTAPTVNAGPDLSGLVGANLALNGSATDDGLPGRPGAIGYRWTQVSGPGTATFADAYARQTEVTCSLAGTYTLALSASDGQSASTDTVDVTVAANDLAITLSAAPETAVAPFDSLVSATVTGGFNEPGVFTETGIGFVLEGESAIVARNADPDGEWAVRTARAGASGGAYLKADVANISWIADNIGSTATYALDAVGGSYEVWIRAWCPSFSEDVAYLHFNDRVLPLFQAKPNTTAWVWQKWGDVRLNPGRNQFVIYRRGRAIEIDKIVLNRVHQVLADVGPATSGTTVGYGPVLWQVDGVTAGTGASIPATVDRIGGLPVTAAVVDGKGAMASASLTLTGTWPAAPAVTTVDGLAVVEAEAPAALVDGTDAVPWAVMRDRLGASAGAYLATPDALGANATTWAAGAGTRYQATLDRADTWTVWVRRYAVDGNANQVQVTWGGVTSTNADTTTVYGKWSWVALASAALPAGDQTLELRRREDGYAIDQVVFAAGTWTPPAAGAAASAAGLATGSAGTAPVVGWTTTPADLSLTVDGTETTDADRYDAIASRQWWLGTAQPSTAVTWTATVPSAATVRLTGAAKDLRGLRGASQWFAIPGFAQDQAGAMLTRSGRRVVAQTPVVGSLVLDGSTPTWTALPASLVGATQLMTNTADGTYPESEAYVLELAVPCRVALVVSSQMMAASKRPAWLDATWVASGTATTSVDSRTVLVKDLPASRLSLGRNTAGRQYSIFILPLVGGGG